MAPILSFTAEEIWTHLPGDLKKEKSVLLSRLPKENEIEIDQNLASRWDQLIQIRNEVAKSLENARARKEIGSSLEAAVFLGATGKLHQFLKEAQKDLPMLFIVSQVELSDELKDEVRETSLGPISVKISRAPGIKCERCWNYSHHVGEINEYSELCERCWPVVKSTLAS
jgi:isoleucyl-tRNA synthetase